MLLKLVIKTSTQRDSEKGIGGFEDGATVQWLTFGKDKTALGQPWRSRLRCNDQGLVPMASEPMRKH